MPAFANQPPISGAVSEPSLSQSEEAPELCNSIDFMDNDEEAQQIKNGDEGTKKTVVISLGVIILVVAIAVGVGIGVSNSSSNSAQDPTEAPALPPALPPTTSDSTPDPALPATTGPTQDPALLERDYMISLIQSHSASTTFSNSSSPQNQALDWILSDSYSSNGLPEDRLVQRFALATLYHSTNGNEWINHGWLHPTNECVWGSENFSCTKEESAVEGLYLFENNLSGRIPIEIGLLTHLKMLSLSYNQLTGSIPSELGLLNQTLVELILLDNKLAGSIPSELGLLTHLNDLYLAGNHLTGSIQPELGLLTQIKSLHLHINELTGTMPPSLCSPSAFILVDCGEIACTCCFEAWFNTTSCA